MTRTQLHVPGAAWEHLAADFMGPLPSGEYMFLLVDYYVSEVVATYMHENPVHHHRITPLRP